MGRHPAAVGVLGDGAAPARLQPGPPGRSPRPGRARPVHVWEDTPDGPVRRLEACQSPVWDTALAIIGLLDAGPARRRPGADPRRRLGARTRRSGARGTGRSAGPGWPPAAGRSSSPTTATRTSTTRPRCCSRCAGWPPATPRSAAAVRARRDLADRHAVQGRRLGRLRRGQHPRLADKLPFCDFGAVIDPPSADVTAHIVEALAAEGLTGSKACAAVWPGCCARRNATGRGSAGGAPTTSTAPARWCPADRGRRAAGASRASAGRWRGWKRTRTRTAAGVRTCAPTTTRAGSAGASSTASQTAWALLALLAAGDGVGDAAERGVRWLGADPARRTARWDEPQFTGTGLPR